MIAGMQWGLLALIGLVAGLASGVFGIGGGVLIVPALVYLFEFSYGRAIGTSLAVLLPPVGAAAVWSYYRASMVDVRAAMLLAAMVFIGAWIGAQGVQRLDAQVLRVLFGLFLIGLGVYTLWSGRS